MLVLTRRINEAIKIGHDIEIKVLGIDGDQVKLGISAPTHVDIHRMEVYLDIQEQNNEAAQVSTDLFNLLKNNTKKIKHLSISSDIYNVKLMVLKAADFSKLVTTTRMWAIIAQGGNIE